MGELIEVYEEHDIIWTSVQISENHSSLRKWRVDADGAPVEMQAGRPS